MRQLLPHSGIFVTASPYVICGRPLATGPAAELQQQLPVAIPRVGLTPCQLPHLLECDTTRAAVPHQQPATSTQQESLIRFWLITGLRIIIVLRGIRAAVVVVVVVVVDDDVVVAGTTTAVGSAASAARPAAVGFQSTPGQSVSTRCFAVGTTAAAAAAAAALCGVLVRRGRRVVALLPPADRAGRRYNRWRASKTSDPPRRAACA